MSYVTPVQEWILHDIQQHAQAWKVPDEIVNDSRQWAEFSTIIKTKLTQQRSAWKNLLAKLYQNGDDINTIMRHFSPKQMVISEDHCARWAFIALCYSDSEEQVEQGNKQSSEFWEYIGKQLERIKREVAAHPTATTAQAQRQMMKAIFAHALADHHVKYPTQTAAGPLGDHPAWQETVETAMDLGVAI